MYVLVLSGCDIIKSLNIKVLSHKRIAIIYIETVTSQSNQYNFYINTILVSIYL